MSLDAGDQLFKEDDRKECLYRIEAGGLCLFRTTSSLRPELIGFAFQGEIMGLGTLERFMWSAQASVASRIGRLPLDAAPALAATDPRIAEQSDQASAREFTILRDRLAEEGRGSPLVRVSAFLLALASVNASEGRQTDIIEDSMTCGTAADMLRMSVEDLRQVLLKLEQRGLLRAEPGGGLKLLDPKRLEALADVQPSGR